MFSVRSIGTANVAPDAAWNRINETIAMNETRYLISGGWWMRCERRSRVCHVASLITNRLTAQNCSRNNFFHEAMVID